jgi:HK97 family phage major capsid protein
MKHSLELRQKRAGIYEQVKGMLDKAAAEKRALDTTEQDAIGKMEAEMESIKKTYEAEERADNIARELAAAPGQEKPADEKRGGIDSEEYRSALWNYALSGEKRADLTVGTAGQAGYLAPTAFEAQVLKYATQANVMRQLADVRTYNTDAEIPVKSVRAVFAYIAEKGAYPEAAQTYIKTGLKAYKFGGVIKVSEELMTDSVVSIEQEVLDEINFGMPRLEESKFISGTGSNEPTGFTATAQTGVTTASATAITFDEVIGLFHALPIAYRRQATWLMHDSIALYVRKLKNSVDGAYLWQPSVVADKPDMILGRPVQYSQDMDSTVAATKKTIAFGDFKNYRIADRTGMHIKRLNELYAGTGQVGFLVSRRNDGLLLIPEAIKLMVQHA